MWRPVGAYMWIEYLGCGSMISISMSLGSWFRVLRNWAKSIPGGRVRDKFFAFFRPEFDVFFFPDEHLTGCTISWFDMVPHTVAKAKKNSKVVLKIIDRRNQLAFNTLMPLNWTFSLIRMRLDLRTSWLYILSCSHMLNTYILRTSSHPYTHHAVFLPSNSLDCTYFHVLTCWIPSSYKFTSLHSSLCLSSFLFSPLFLHNISQLYPHTKLTHSIIFLPLSSLPTSSKDLQSSTLSSGGARCLCASGSPWFWRLLLQVARFFPQEARFLFKNE